VDNSVNKIATERETASRERRLYQNAYFLGIGRYTSAPQDMVASSGIHKFFTHSEVKRLDFIQSPPWMRENRTSRDGISTAERRF